ncbi:hypothetical protein [Nesterenkonia sp. HG001]|uniref:hypothetical protein n=1 Tax=Nesterenkonia sp. HG001 TaxID=2983207 RepID=UPI002AC3971E|nr:hypothetical protein [Nesterenkonia sp. HG001]MDZ5076766.1 hypothetical protein [Nesterenkonia sp. HG001]
MAPQRTPRWRVERHTTRGWVTRTPEGHIIRDHPTHQDAIGWAQRRAYRATLPPIVGAVLYLIGHGPTLRAFDSKEDYTLAI